PPSAGHCTGAAALSGCLQGSAGEVLDLVQQFDELLLRHGLLRNWMQQRVQVVDVASNDVGRDPTC
ncbi:MAG: hypothetical protein KJ747_03695, partial [Actinobacteria bacterium]|nr:hypothetical protein [Actinomycetota bacterium]